MKIIFVCLGNICRSTLAEGIARKKIKERGLSIETDSAGTSNYEVGNRADIRSIKVAKNHDIDITDLIARQLNLYKDDDKDLILVMDDFNYNDTIKMGFDKGKVYKIGYFGGGNESIEDPYHYSEISGFEEVYQRLDKYIDNLLDKVERGEI